MTMQYQNSLTLGNIITILTLVAGMAIGYSKLQSEQAHQAKEIAAMEAAAKIKVAEIEASVKAVAATVDLRADANEVRIRAVELTSATQTVDLRNIAVGISEIKGAIERLSADKTAARR